MMYPLGMFAGVMCAALLVMIFGMYIGPPVNTVNECRAANPGYDCSVEVRWVKSEPWQ